MSWYMLLLICLILMGSLTLAYQMYKIVELDAESRGFKHPKLWGLFSTSGQNSSGLILYMIGRRKYPSDMSDTDKRIIASRKKKAYASLVLLSLSAIGIFIILILKF